MSHGKQRLQCVFRTFAQLVVLELLERFPGGCGVQSSAHLAAAQRFLAGNADLLRLRGSIGGGVSSFHPDMASSPRGIFCVVCPVVSLLLLS